MIEGFEHSRVRRLYVLDYGLFRVHSNGRIIGITGSLIETEDGRRILVDTGFDAGAAAVRDFVVPVEAPTSARTETSAGPTSSGPVDEARFIPGTVLGKRYRIVGLLGRGGMGEVYRVERADGRYEKQAALKLLATPLNDGDVGSGSFRARFERRADSTPKIQTRRQEPVARRVEKRPPAASRPTPAEMRLNRAILAGLGWCWLGAATGEPLAGARVTASRRRGRQCRLPTPRCPPPNASARLRPWRGPPLR